MPIYQRLRVVLESAFREAHPGDSIAGSI